MLGVVFLFSQFLAVEVLVVDKNFLSPLKILTP